MAMENKKIYQVQQEKAMKKVSATLQKIADSQPSNFELIYHQKVHSAAQFEAVKYDMSNILDYVTD